MRIIQTVTGSIKPEQLGTVLSHEHFVFGWPGWEGDLSSDAFDEEEFIETLRGGIMARLAKFGVKTVVDATPNDAGRKPEVLRDIAKAFDINILCATGYYSEGSGSPSYFKHRKIWGCDVEKDIQELYERELYEGIRKTGIRADFIKLAASGKGITPYEMYFFKAAAKVASKDRNVRIYCHHTAGGALTETSNFFLENDVDPRQVTLGHVCANSDIPLQIDLGKKGFYLGYDRFGLDSANEATPTDNGRMDKIVELVNAGCEDNIMISVDRIIRNLGRQEDYNQDIFGKICGKQDLPRIFEEIIPKLHKKGLSTLQTQKFVETNPVRFYSQF